MASILDIELKSYLNKLNEAEKESVLLMLKTFLKGRIKKKERITIDQYNKELDEAMEQVKRREVFSHDEVVKIIKGRNG